MFGNRNWIKAYIVDVLPCISIAFFVLAYEYNSSFYSVFGIDIIQYATFGDIFLSITEPIILYAMFILVILFYFGIYLVVPEKRENVAKRKPNFKYLRFLVKVRNIIIIRSVFANMNRRLIYACQFFSVMFPLGLCYMVYWNFIRTGYISPTLYSCVIALIVPVVLYLFFLLLYSLFSTQTITNILNNLRKYTFEVISFFVLYYMCAITLFKTVGFEYGEQIKYGDNFEFEIQTMNDSVFTDKEYIYIGHLSDYTFLYKKETLENIILGKDGIVYTKIYDRTNINNDYANRRK